MVVNKKIENDISCKCGDPIDGHLSKNILNSHHYWYIHEGDIKKLSEYCDICLRIYNMWKEQGVIK